MQTVYTEAHRRQDGHSELFEGRLVTPFEMPRRAEIVIGRVREVGLGEILAPKEFGLAPVQRIHDRAFVAFLRDAWQDWVATGREFDALPHVWPVPGLMPSGQRRLSDSIDGKLGYYAIDAGTPIVAGTWEAITASANVALTGEQILAEGASAAFALCRPPGHHAGSDFYGGYCFFNNAAIAAQAMLDRGMKRVAILDVDYHHGNGTQQIFYSRSDVLTISLHADPRQEFPYFLGYADETGTAAGEGFHLNLPLPWGVDWSGYGTALDHALARIRADAPEALVVSLGLDTFEHDPISRFKLKAEDYPRMGQKIAGLKLPTLFVFEGGYAVDALGVNAVSVLTGFEDAR
jgi:acetoin utilization deacetylase AcuC-like enzyme